MTKDGFRIERYNQVFIVDTGEAPFGSAAAVGIVALAAAGFTALFAWNLSTIEIAGIYFGFLLFFSPFFLIGSHRWTTEIDTATRRLTITRQSFGRWRKTTADCSLDDCSALGTIEYNGAEGVVYGMYVQLKNGKRHEIPSSERTSEANARIASRLSAATEVPRLDTIR